MVILEIFFFFFFFSFFLDFPNLSAAGNVIKSVKKRKALPFEKFSRFKICSPPSHYMDSFSFIVSYQNILVSILDIRSFGYIDLIIFPCHQTITLTMIAKPFWMHLRYVPNLSFECFTKSNTGSFCRIFQPYVIEILFSARCGPC